ATATRSTGWPRTPSARETPPPWPPLSTGPSSTTAGSRRSAGRWGASAIGWAPRAIPGRGSGPTRGHSARRSAGWIARSPVCQLGDAVTREDDEPGRGRAHDHGAASARGIGPQRGAAAQGIGPTARGAPGLRRREVRRRHRRAVDLATMDDQLEHRRDEERRPVEEAGGGEAEGFEQAEEALVEHAEHTSG